MPWGMLVLYHKNLTILAMMLDKVSVEPLFQIRAFQRKVIVSLWLEVRKQWGIEHNESGMR